jgi:nucleolar GTP-binding protein
MSIRPLLANKPVVLVANKSDLVRLQSLPLEDKQLLASALQSTSSSDMDESTLNQTLSSMFLETSTMTEEGVMQVRNAACEKLLAMRVEQRIQSNRVQSILNKIHVTVPKPRDEVSRPPFIPEAVKSRASGEDLGERRMLEKDMEAANGGAGVYSVDIKKHYILRNEAHKYDIIPEIMNGKNIADFIDPDIAERLLQLEQEEEEKTARGDYYVPVKSEEDRAIEDMHRKLTEKRRLAAILGRMTKSNRHIIMPRTKMLSKSKNNKNNGQDKDANMQVEDEDYEDVDMDMDQKHVDKDLSLVGLKNVSSMIKATRMRHKAEVHRNKLGKAGEADRHIMTAKPRHLFAGKRGVGKTDYR